MNNLQILQTIAENNSEPFYIYDLDVIEEKVHQVKCAFPDFQLLYSLKANPHPSIIKLLTNCAVGFDAASANEVQKSVDGGANTDLIYYSSPGKIISDLHNTVGKCVIIADSINEITLLNSLASFLEIKLSIGVRINITNSLITRSTHEVMGGNASKFGISLEDFRTIKRKDYPYLVIEGIHVYFGSQLLDVELIHNNFQIIATTALRELANNNLKFINFGGGFGVPYQKSDEALNLSQLSKCIYEDVSIKELLNTSVKCNLELGRYIVAESGMFVTRIVDIKYSFGKKYVIINGGMNAFYRPIMTSDYHNIIQFNTSDIMENVTVVGKLCTPIDQYYDDISLHLPSIGDLIAFENAGAYGYSMSLLEFISHNKPSEIIVGGNNIDIH